MPTATVPATAEPQDRYVALPSQFSRAIDPESKVDVTCWLSTSAVDDDNEVLIPEGCDLGRFEKNGPLLIGHDYKGTFYPLPIGQVLWVKRRPGGLFGGIKFGSSVMAQEVKALVEDEILRGVSVGFKTLEQSKMTLAEANSRPDWKAAYDRTNGRITMIRRWKLGELSVTPLPCNEDALIQTLRTKGMKRPAWIPPAPKTEPTMAEDEHEDSHETRAEETAPTEVATDPETKAAPVDDLEVKAVVSDDEPDEDDAEEEGPIRNGHFVKMVKGAYRGCVGKVKSVHRSGPVPDVDDDVMGSKADPAMRVCAYKAMGDGHKETAHHFGAKVAHAEKTEDLKPPKGKKAYEPPPKQRVDVEILPSEVRTDAQVKAERTAAALAAIPSDIVDRAVRTAIDRVKGVV